MRTIHKIELKHYSNTKGILVKYDKNLCKYIVPIRHWRAVINFGK